MRANRLFLPVLLLLALIFAITTQAIVSVTMMELRVQIASERILNYELSSRMLKNRFRQMLSGEDNVKNEIKMNVLESSVLNFDSLDLEGTNNALNTYGLLVINGVRRLNFKPPIRLQEDREFMTALQYAFYMERNRRYDVSFKKYNELIDKMGKSGSDTSGFLKLHAGYCAALKGEVNEAIPRLKQVIEEFPGTHYAETAQLILDILGESARRLEKIEKTGGTDREIGAALFRAGSFGAALVRLRKVQDPTLEERYMIARSMEETGEIKEATAGYISVVNEGGTSDPAVKSNRRLMLIGNFYNGGKEVKQQSEQNAARLGDKEVLQDVKEGKELQLKPVVVEKILKSGNADSNILAEIKKEMETAEAEERANSISRPVIGDEVAVVPGRPVLPDLVMARPVLPGVFAMSQRLIIRFRDGRVIKGTTINVDGDIAHVSSGDFSVNVPVTNIEKIETSSSDLKCIFTFGTETLEGDRADFTDKDIKFSGQTRPLKSLKEIRLQ